ncbi:uncharacterized protein LOC113217381 [Frankliniella occidentalis]|uniref:Uncharacterized protein LOC113217381 n=1 Tax=Frankliniella occidentalis TaxID=133901 RepID=A0A9C6U183_FRAOC|nr:uncharacterized protein LOC113217381 [Frankliniella occidentalis]
MSPAALDAVRCYQPWCAAGAATGGGLSDGDLVELHERTAEAARTSAYPGGGGAVLARVQDAFPREYRAVVVRHADRRPDLTTFWSRLPVPLALPLALPGGARRPRSEKKPTPEDQKDQRYLERRRRNNRAAKKSRDARRAREDQVALRAALLEHENAVLRAQVLTLREETHQLRQLLVGKPLQPLQPLHHLHAARRDEAQLAPPTELLLRRMMPV